MKKLKNTPEVRQLHREAIKWFTLKCHKLTGLKEVEIIKNGKKKKVLKIYPPDAKHTFNLKPEMTYKQKKVINAIKKAVVHLNILGLLFIVACGSDNPVNNGNTPTNGNEILSFDTLLVRGISSVVDSLHSETLTKTVRIDFKVETNAVNTDIPSIGYKYGYWQSLTDSLNGEHSFTITRDSSKPTDVLLQLFLSADTSKYLRVLNAKVYKIN